MERCRALACWRGGRCRRAGRLGAARSAPEDGLLADAGRGIGGLAFTVLVLLGS